MKYASYLQLSIIIIIFSFTMEQYLDLTTHYYYVEKQNNNWNDLLDKLVSCPNKGVFKNFIIEKNSTHFWFKYQCYSSKKSGVDYGETILKTDGLYYFVTYKSHTIDNYITSANELEITCGPDFSLRSFKIYYDDNVPKTQSLCNGVKASYTTTWTIETEKKTAEKSTMDALFNVMVGRTDQENDVEVGFPLRGFKFVVDTSKSKDNPTVYFKYSYSVLRNMKELRDSYKQRFEQLRNSNTQKN